MIRFKKNLFSFGIFFFVLVPISAYAETKSATEELYPIFQKFGSSYEMVQDYSAVFLKEEKLDGKWVKEKMAVYEWILTESCVWNFMV